MVTGFLIGMATMYLMTGSIVATFHNKKCDELEPTFVKQLGEQFKAKRLGVGFMLIWPSYFLE